MRKEGKVAAGVCVRTRVGGTSVDRVDPMDERGEQRNEAGGRRYFTLHFFAKIFEGKIRMCIIHGYSEYNARA